MRNNLIALTMLVVVVVATFTIPTVEFVRIYTASKEAVKEARRPVPGGNNHLVPDPATAVYRP